MKKHIFVFVSIFIFTAAFAQKNSSASDKLKAFAKNAARFSNNYTQEKVYLHFDNTAYFLSETIWFKAYVVNALVHTPTNMSKTLHVELRTSEGHLIEGKKVRITNGVGIGEFFLPDSLPGGFYEIRAFTRAMLNFGEDVIFSRVFPVFDKASNENDYENRSMTPRLYSIPNLRNKKPYNGNLLVEFFPEGGKLIRGTKTNVAFKVFNDDGRSLDAELTLYNAENKAIGKFRTKHLGMGAFPIEVNSDNYSAEIRVGKNNKTVALPMVHQNGFVMICDNPTGDSITFNIQKTINISEKDSLALLVTSKGKLIDFYTFHVPNEGQKIGINTKRWPAGVYQYTLYDTTGQQQADRLLFKYPSLKANLSIQTNKSKYKPFEKVQLTVTALDTFNTKYGTSISLAVRDAAKSIAGNSDNQTLATNLLLSSDLKGYIENPLWYFSEKTAEKLEALDLLMLTQSGRRYDWEYMSGLKPFKAPHPIEEGILVDGEARSIWQKKIVPNTEYIYWMTRGKAGISGKTKTDSSGTFNFIVNMYDDWELNLASFVKEKQKDLRILIHRSFTPKTKWLSELDKDVWLDKENFIPKDIDSTNVLGKVNYSKKTSKTVDGVKEITFKEFIITEEKKETFNEAAARKASLRYNLDAEADLTRDQGAYEYSNIKEFLLDTNPYFQTSNGKFTYKGKKAIVMTLPSKYYKGITSRMDDPGERVILYEDVEEILIVEDGDVIAYSDVLTKDGFFIDDSYVLVIYYLKPPDRRKEVRGVRKTILKGYALPKTFYSPTYTPYTEDLEPDYRRTLYWNPDFYLDPKTGKKTLEFFHSKNSVKGIKISAEGITGNGTILHN